MAARHALPLALLAAAGLVPLLFLLRAAAGPARGAGAASPQAHDAQAEAEPRAELAAAGDEESAAREAADVAPAGGAQRAGQTAARPNLRWDPSPPREDAGAASAAGTQE